MLSVADRDPSLGFINCLILKDFVTKQIYRLRIKIEVYFILKQFFTWIFVAK